MTNKTNGKKTPDNSNKNYSNNNNNNNTHPTESYEDSLLFSVQYTDLNQYLKSKNHAPAANGTKLHIETLKEASVFFNNAIKNKIALSKIEIRYIFKKFQQNRKWGANPTSDKKYLDHVIMVYKFIIELYVRFYPNSADELNKIHSIMIDFYCEHSKYFNNTNNNTVLNFALAVFNSGYPAAKGRHSFASVVRAYALSDQQKEAHDFIWSEKNVAYHGFHHEHNLTITRNLRGTQAAISYYENLREHDATLLSSYEHRLILNLILDEIVLNNGYNPSLIGHYKNIVNALVNQAIEIYSMMPTDQITDQVFRAMLKIYIKSSDLDTVKAFFNSKFKQNHPSGWNLRESTYWQMIKCYWKHGAFRDAELLLNAAYAAGCFPYNHPEKQKDCLQLNLHEIGTTGGGKSYYGGKDKWSHPLLIHDLFRRILSNEYENSVINGILTIKIICGIGGGKVKDNITKILKHYGLTPNKTENKGGVSVFHCDYADLFKNSDRYKQFYIEPSTAQKFRSPIQKEVEPADAIQLSIMQNRLSDLEKVEKKRNLSAQERQEFNNLRNSIEKMASKTEKWTAQQFYRPKKVDVNNNKEETGCYWCIGIKNKNILNTTNANNLTQHLGYFTKKRHNSSFNIYETLGSTINYINNKNAQMPSIPGDHYAGFIVFKLNMSGTKLNQLLEEINDNSPQTDINDSIEGIYQVITRAAIYKMENGTLASSEIDLSLINHSNVNNISPSNL